MEWSMKRALVVLALATAEPMLAQSEDPRGFIGLNMRFGVAAAASYGEYVMANSGDDDW
jgi:hypothetical protein